MADVDHRPDNGCVETEDAREGYRACVGIFLLDKGDRLFVGQRADVRQPAWQLPQGGIDPGEDAHAAGLREMQEEIGTNKATLLATSRVWRSYDLPVEIASRMWKGRYRGQTQRWLAYRFEGADADIRLDGEHPEFTAHRWIEPEILPALTVPFKRAVYASVIAEFRPLWTR